jgi:hypothetical protein
VPCDADVAKKISKKFAASHRAAMLLFKWQYDVDWHRRATPMQ